MEENDKEKQFEDDILMVQLDSDVEVDKHHKKRSHKKHHHKKDKETTIDEDDDDTDTARKSEDDYNQEERDRYKSIKRKDSATSDLQGYEADRLGRMSDRVAGGVVEKVGDKADKFQREEDKEDEFDKKIDEVAKS